METEKRNTWDITIKAIIRQTVTFDKELTSDEALQEYRSENYLDIIDEAIEAVDDILDID